MSDASVIARYLCFNVKALIYTNRNLTRRLCENEHIASQVKHFGSSKSSKPLLDVWIFLHATISVHPRNVPAVQAVCGNEAEKERERKKY
jgi:hypothetical protein